MSSPTLSLIDPEEPRPRPSGAGDLAGDLRQRPPALALPLEPILEHQHGDGLALPFPHQLGALAQPDRTASDEITTVRHGHGELGQPALAAGAQPAMDLLLDLPGDAEQQQLAADPRGRQRAVPSSPLRPQSFRIHLRDRRRAWRGARPSAWPPCSERCRRGPVAKSAPIPEATHVPGYRRAAWPQAAPPGTASWAAGLSGGSMR